MHEGEISDIGHIAHVRPNADLHTEKMLGKRIAPCLCGADVLVQSAEKQRHASSSFSKPPWRGVVGEAFAYEPTSVNVLEGNMGAMALVLAFSPRTPALAHLRWGAQKVSAWWSPCAGVPRLKSFYLTVRRLLLAWESSDPDAPADLSHAGRQFI